MLYRMQHFIDGYLYQFNKFNIPSELIIVDWNPPVDRPPLAEVLKIPAQLGSCAIRFITFPAELHHKLPHGAELPLFQMIAKNVGIRRARGKLVAATNIDILFSDAIMHELKKDLPSGFFYRADRYDAPHELPQIPDYKQILEFCEKESFRKNLVNGTYTKMNNQWLLTQPIGKIIVSKDDIIPDYSLHHYYHNITAQVSKLISGMRRVMMLPFQRIARAQKWHLLLTADFWKNAVIATGNFLRLCLRYAKIIARHVLAIIKSILRLMISVLRKLFKPQRKDYVVLHLHTNACGDFTMLTRDDWFRLRGYLEWPIFSWNLDSVLLYQAIFNGLKQQIFSNAPHYHIEHGKGSGYTPEGAETLFKRIEAKGIPYMDWPGFLAELRKMYHLSLEQKPVQYNDENWGYADTVLSEVTFD